MLTELFNKIQELQRPFNIALEGKDYLYNDHEERYEIVHKSQYRSISNVESFAQVVLEEARRLENLAGDNMTVIFTLEGAKFYSNDKKSGTQDKWDFKRCLAQQWDLACRATDNPPMKHLDLLRYIQKLRPSIGESYKDLFNDFKSVSFAGKTIATSQPLLEGGKSNATLSFNLQADSNSGETHVSLPGVIPLTLQYARAGDVFYQTSLEVDGALDSEDKIKFRLIWPEKEIIIERALKDEVEYFKEQTKNMSKLLTVLSY